MLSHFSYVQLFLTLWTVVLQAPLSMGISRQEYWSGLPCTPPGDLANPGIEPSSLKFPALPGGFFTTSTTWEALRSLIYFFLIFCPAFIAVNCTWQIWGVISPWLEEGLTLFNCHISPLGPLCKVILLPPACRVKCHMGPLDPRTLEHFEIECDFSPKDFIF